MKLKIAIISSFFALSASAQTYWQQEANYKMVIDMDADKHQFTGEQEIEYTNHSPDTLNKVFYHLYFNAFQPGSMMDVRSRSIKDPDRRVTDRIFYLKDDEIGYHKVKKLKQDGKKLNFHVEGTIVEVELKKPLLPGETTVLSMDFESQVPLQIRRSGRDNKEGIEFSMTQWYPKLAEYDQEGWHAHPYIGREFHGIWGDYDVTIKMDKKYMIGATGVLQNPNEIGHDYLGHEVDTDEPSGDKYIWIFKAENVIDFAWAADPDYVHEVVETKDGLKLHFYYQNDTSIVDNWKELIPRTVDMFEFMNENFGQYPYPQYSVIQGGDGGMEYPMLTLITGERSLGSLTGVTLHEMIHSWYQAVLATNEAKYAWMDEGFNTYVGNIAWKALFGDNSDFIHSGAYRGYFALLNNGNYEPMTTHSDHYGTNQAYGVGSYSMGAVYLSMLEYVIGEDQVRKGMKRYYNTWKFKHPEPRDFKRVMEKVSGLELDWYHEYLVEQMHPIDYGIKSVLPSEKGTQILLERVERFPMPIDLKVEFTNGDVVWYNIPLSIMRGEKPAEGENWNVLSDWPWTHPQYEFQIDRPVNEIKSIEIDPSQRMADWNRDNNTFPFSDELRMRGE